MITRPTSLKVYREIEEEGLLSRMRFKVYSTLFKYGPMTAGELTHRIKGPNEVHPSYHRRLDELGDLGVAERLHIRPCEITGRNAYVWAVTNKLPGKKPESRLGRAALVAALKRYGGHEEGCSGDKCVCGVR